MKEKEFLSYLKEKISDIEAGNTKLRKYSIEDLSTIQPLRSKTEIKITIDEQDNA